MVRRSIGRMAHWSDGPLVQRPIGPMVQRSDDPLVRCRSALMVQRSIGPMTRFYVTTVRAGSIREKYSKSLYIKLNVPFSPGIQE